MKLKNFITINLSTQEEEKLSRAEREIQNMEKKLSSHFLATTKGRKGTLSRAKNVSKIRLNR